MYPNGIINSYRTMTVYKLKYVQTESQVFKGKLITKSLEAQYQKQRQKKTYGSAS